MLHPDSSEYTLDKDLDKLTRIEAATHHALYRLIAPGLGLIFLGVAMAVAGLSFFEPSALVVAAAAVAAYMAMNIGANDVTNNVGAAVGGRAMTMTQALIIAAIFEILGATIAGGEVVKTVSSALINPAHSTGSASVSWIMMAALLAAALWINLATWLRAPVSTTHAIIGAVIGAGVMATGIKAVNWPVIAEISASWVVSPLLSGSVAALFLYGVKSLVIYRENKIEAARVWVPVMIALMAGGFSAYMILQLAPLGWLSGSGIVGTGFISALVVWFAVKPLIRHQSRHLENRNSELKTLFRIPLLCSAALLSFAHGANDVSNVVGPLSAIVHSLSATTAAHPSSPPLWVMLIGALGISIGVLLFGPRLINLVGKQITKLNPMRAYCIALSTAFTVIIASWFGFPVSTTHVAIGAVFGVGFFREWYIRHSRQRLRYLQSKGKNKPLHTTPEHNLDEARRRALVRRSHLMTMLSAWIFTVPLSAALAAVIYWIMVTLFI